MGRPYIKGGTPLGAESKCRTCSYAHIITGFRESEQVTICTLPTPEREVPFPVYGCTSYYDKNRPTWDQMEKLAIDVTPAPLKPVGFKLELSVRDTVVTRKSADTENEDTVDD